MRPPPLRAVAATALVFLLSAAAARAYNDEPDADRVFPGWMAPRVSEPLPGFFAPNDVCYEVRPAGHHAAEIHFRNLSNSTCHFDFWFPGWQDAGDNLVGSSRVDLQACKLEYSIVSPK